MKELFTLDNFMVAFISALGYGFGEIIARLSGWPELLCIAASMALGVISEGIINRIVFCKAVQKSRTNRIITYAAILLIFQLAQYFSTRWMGISMLEYLQDQFLYVVGLPIVGFVVNLLIRRYRVWRIQERYGDGSMINEELSEMVQALLMKYINGEPLQLYHNEIPGIDEFDWKAYPLALIVSDGKIMSDTIEGRITEDKGLLEFMLQ